MEQERMEAFANKIWKWNRKLRMIDWLFVAVYYVVLFAFVAGLVIAKKRGLELSRYIIIFNAADALFMQLLYGFLYGHVFIAAEGREGKTIQELMFTLKNMPFSPEEYYAFIWKGFQKRIGWNAVISFAVLSNAFYISGNVKMLWLSLLYVAVASAVAATGFFRHRYSVLKYFNREGNKRKKIFKKKEKERKHGNWFGAATDTLIIFAITNGALGIVRDCLITFRPEEVYVHTKSAVLHPFLYASLLILCESLAEYLKKKSVDVNKVISGVLVLSLTVAAYLGCYETYYADHIEKHRLFWTKTYTWDEVVSYSVGKRFFWHDIQLYLELPDSRMNVLCHDFMATEEFHDLYIDENSDEYVNNCVYIDALVKRLDEAGVPGTYKDGDKLMEYAKKLIEEEGRDKAIDRLLDIEKRAGAGDDS